MAQGRIQDVVVVTVYTGLGQHGLQGCQRCMPVGKHMRVQGSCNNTCHRGSALGALHASHEHGVSPSPQVTARDRDGKRFGQAAWEARQLNGFKRPSVL